MNQLSVFFSTTLLLFHKFGCLNVNVVQNDLKVFEVVRGERVAGWFLQSFICLAWVYRLESSSCFSSQLSLVVLL